MAKENLDADHRVVRYVPWAKLRRDENDNVLGVLPQAFSLRADEEYLSVTWCEYFSGTPDEQLRCAIEAIRGSAIDVRPKAQFATGVVGEIRAHMQSDPKNHRLRFVHEPTQDNDAHAAIKRWPDHSDDLLELLAAEIWADCTDKTQADALPLGQCQAAP